MVKRQNVGFTLIEVLVAVAVMSVIAIAFFGLFNQVLKFVQIKRIRMQAAMLGTEQMELIRNLKYSDVGTVAGIPAGVIPQTQNLSRGGVNYTVSADVRYIDDPFDGLLGGEPDDLLNIDYKQAKITTAWQTRWGLGSMFFLSSIAPEGLESASGGGTLKLHVMNASGGAMPQALVDIINPYAGVNLIYYLTNDNGLILLPGAPAGLGVYQITVDKLGGYSGARTYGLDDPAGNILPAPAHLAVSLGNTAEATFGIDLTGTLNVRSAMYNPFGVPTPVSADYSIFGAKTIGELADGSVIYKNIYNGRTDNLGQVALIDLEWDSYTIDFHPGATAGFNIMQYSPPDNPITVLPSAATSSFVIFYSPYSAYSLLVTLKDQSEVPLIGVNVTLARLAATYSATLLTGITGQTFFPDLQSATYGLSVINPGYLNIDSVIDVDGNKEEPLTMMPDL